jgi:hypothetical protein
MRLPRKAILIRLAIYLPLLGFFGWRAYQHWQAERAAQSAPPPAPVGDPLQDLPSSTIEVDGRPVRVYEITPAQAEEYFGAAPAPAAEPAGE